MGTQTISKTYSYFSRGYNTISPNDSDTSLNIYDSYPLTNSYGSTNGTRSSTKYTQYYGPASTYGKACSYRFTYTGGVDTFPYFELHTTTPTVRVRVKNAVIGYSYFTSINARLYSLSSGTALSDGVSLLRSSESAITTSITMYNTTSAWDIFKNEGLYLRITATYNSDGAALSAANRQTQACLRVYGGELAISYPVPVTTVTIQMNSTNLYSGVYTSSSSAGSISSCLYTQYISDEGGLISILDYLVAGNNTRTVAPSRNTIYLIVHNFFYTHTVTKNQVVIEPCLSVTRHPWDLTNGYYIPTTCYEITVEEGDVITVSDKSGPQQYKTYIKLDSGFVSVDNIFEKMSTSLVSENTGPANLFKIIDPKSLLE